MSTRPLPALPALAALATLTLGALLPLPTVAAAQQPTAVPNDTALALPIKPVRTLRFTTDEATWISLDVSPDGKTIVFDILGDLYTIPIAGGTATRLTSGMAWDCMPRWSPDGRSIAFISDRDGGDNLWLVNPDGTGARKITKEVDNALSSPMWSPDGQYIVVRRFGAYPTEENYLTNVPLWMYHVNGGNGVKAAASVRVVPEGGKVVIRDKSLRLEGATSCTIFISAATDYFYVDPARRSATVIESATKKGKEVILTDHVSDYQKYFSAPGHAHIQAHFAEMRAVCELWPDRCRPRDLPTGCASALPGETFAGKV